VGYGGMLTEGFLSTMVIGVMASYGTLALADSVFKAATAGGNTAALINKIAGALGVGAVTSHGAALSFAKALAASPAAFGQFYAGLANALKWSVIPLSYAYATNAAFGLDITAMAIFATLWITGFALTSLDTATRLGRYAWQELMEPLRSFSESAYRVLSNKWLASVILAGLGILLAATKQFLIIWPAFAGMNQLLSSLALMTVAVWVSKEQRATALGKALVIAPAIFMWITVTIALLWYEAVVVPPMIAAGGTKALTGAVVGIITGVGVALNAAIFLLWLSAMRKPAARQA